MIYIKKSKAGWRVQYTGKNGEILAVSEVLTSKQNAWKNVRAMLELYKKDNTYLGDGDKEFVVGWDYETRRMWKLMVIKGK